MNTMLAQRPGRHRAPMVPSHAMSWPGPGSLTGPVPADRRDRLSGLHHGRIAEIRLTPGGADDAGSVTWVLAAACPAFDVVLGECSTLPAWLARAIGDVPVAAPIWQGVGLIGSESGLLALRAARSPLPQAYLHDLWLLERIADALELLPLPAGNLSGEPLPIGFGRWEGLTTGTADR